MNITENIWHARNNYHNVSTPICLYRRKTGLAGTAVLQGFETTTFYSLKRGYGLKMGWGERRRKEKMISHYRQCLAIPVCLPLAVCTDRYYGLLLPPLKPMEKFPVECSGRKTSPQIWTAVNRGEPVAVKTEQIWFLFLVLFSKPLPIPVYSSPASCQSSQILVSEAGHPAGTVLLWMEDGVVKTISTGQGADV